MKKNILKHIIILSGLIIVFLYVFLMFVIPFLVNTQALNQSFINDAKNFLNVELQLNNIKIKPHFNLVYDITIDGVDVKSPNSFKSVISADNLKCKTHLFNIKSISSDYLYFNQKEFSKLRSTKESSSSFSLKSSKIPQIYVKMGELVLENNNKPINIFVNDFVVQKNNNESKANFHATITSPLLKNSIEIQNDGYITYKNSNISLDNLRIKFGNSDILLNGSVLDSKNNSDLKIQGKNLPVHDIEAFTTYFWKLNKGGKVFLENFYDYSGTIDVDLTYKNKSLFGKCVAHSLAAKSVMFDVPIMFNIAEFIFDGKDVHSEAYGLLGGEKVYNAFILKDIMTPQYRASGRVASILTNDFVSTYIPDTRLSGKADVSVRYSIKNQKINVSYLLKLNSGSDVYYKNAFLGLYNFDRRVFVKTLKTGDIIKLTHYDYSLRDGSDITNIITGDGLFTKENGKFGLKYINCKTNGYAPASVTGSFGKYVEGGFFDGNLQYDCKLQKLLGNFTLVDSHYKDFYVEKAHVVADSNIMNVIANGSYDNSPYNCSVIAENDFNKKIHIHDMDLFLDEFVLKTSNSEYSNKHIMIPDVAKDFDISIDNWNIQLKKLSHKRIYAKNIFAKGYLKNNIFDFTSNNVSFAKGYVNAEGWYNFGNHSSCIDFIANKIDSNTVADVVFGLPNQISGLASASLHLETKNRLDDIKGCAKFSVKDGYLTNLGNTSFFVKNSRNPKKSFNLSLSKLTNIDISNPKVFASDIKGSFLLDDYKIENIKLTSKQKYLSMFIEGEYDIDKENADLQLWGKYNKSAQKGVRVLFVPLSWIVNAVFRPEKTKILYQNKLDMVPNVSSNDEDVQPFRVKLNGNLNSRNLEIQLKRIY